MKNSHFTVSDFFCGAGGSSQGVRKLAQRYNGGLEVKLAMNHWKLAIETHNTNFPETTHVCTDISACDPRRYFSTTIAVMSPECTTHSPAGGNNHKAEKKQMEIFESGKVDPATERSRATMWDVCRFAEYHQYEAIIVENVVEAKTKWVLFDNWLNAMHILGYKHKCVYLNSMHFFPTPQSRDRMYVVFWKKGNREPNLEFMPLAWCSTCSKNINAVQVFKNQERKFGKFKQQYLYRCPVHGHSVEPYYYAAFNCIDWTDLGQRIGDRAKPLAPNTVKRIDYGLNKYGNKPLILHTMYSDKARGVIRPVMENAAFTQSTFTSQAICTNPFIVDDKQTTGIDYRVKDINDVTSTVHCDPRIKLVTPPFIISDKHATGLNCRVKRVDETTSTIDTDGSRIRLITPFIIQAEQSSNLKNAKPVNETVNTQATRQTMGILTPFIVDGNFTPGSSRASSVEREMPTQNAQQRNGIAIPLVVSNYGNSNSKPASDPIPSQTTHQTSGILTTEAWNSFFASYHNGSNCTNHFTEAMGTIPTKENIGFVNYETPKIEDCFYRMMKANEIKLAMAFDHDYIVLGSSKDQVKQCGNAVTPPVMEWLVERVVESLEGIQS